MSTKFHGHKVSHDALEEIRIRAVQRVLDGDSPEKVIRVLKMSDRTIYKWLEKYHNGGFDALRAKPVPGRPPKLKATQLEWLSKTIRGKNPLQLSFKFALWTLPIVCTSSQCHTWLMADLTVMMESPPIMEASYGQCYAA